VPLQHHHQTKPSSSMATGLTVVRSLAHVLLSVMLN
jgi:hypothetical protein